MRAIGVEAVPSVSTQPGVGVWGGGGKDLLGMEGGGGHVEVSQTLLAKVTAILKS
jgi:hypothetical protein